MKRFLASKWIFLLIAIFVGAPLLNIVSLTSPASAGSPALQQIVDNVSDQCKNMNQGGDTWKKCEQYQKNLNIFAGCSDSLFGPKDSNGKRSFEQPKLDDCQKKINDTDQVTKRAGAMLKFIKDKCNDVSDIRGIPSLLVNSALLTSSPSGFVVRSGLGGNWKNCEGMQNLLTTIGCSSTMFEKISSNVIRNKWSYKQDEVDACQKVIEAIATDPATKPGDGITATGDTAADGSSDGATTGTNCAGGSMGWLFCPMIDYMAKTVQILAGLIENLMTVRFLSGKDSGAQLFGAWQTFVSIGNLLLVVGFLVIIFSQATGAGLSNYGVKRMMPRLIIAALLINVSFYICAFAIDISNIIGNSIMNLFVASNGGVAESVEQATGGDGNFVSGALAGAILIGVVFFLLWPVLLSFLGMFVMLVMRQVILMALVLMSPLAFAAWLLPNTEQWFKKWWSMFFQLLVLFPAIMLVFGAGLYLSNLLGSPDVGTNIISG